MARKFRIQICDEGAGSEGGTFFRFWISKIAQYFASDSSERIENKARQWGGGFLVVRENEASPARKIEWNVSMLSLAARKGAQGAAS